MAGWILKHFQQGVDILTAQQFMHVLFNDLRHMGDNHRQGINDGIAVYSASSFSFSVIHFPLTLTISPKPMVSIPSIGSLVLVGSKAR